MTSEKIQQLLNSIETQSNIMIPEFNEFEIPNNLYWRMQLTMMAGDDLFSEMTEQQHNEMREDVTNFYANAVIKFAK